MFFFDCEKGFVPDSGEMNVTDGSVENFDMDWDIAANEPPEEELPPEI